MINPKITQFNSKLHNVFLTTLDADDISICISSLIIHYGVEYKKPYHLDDEMEMACALHFSDDVAAYFADEINNEAHNRFEVFNNTCMRFLDYSKAIFAPKKLPVSKTVVVRVTPAGMGSIDLADKKLRQYETRYPNLVNREL